MIAFLGRALLALSLFCGYWGLFFAYRCRKGLLPFYIGAIVWALGEWAFPLFGAWWVPATLASTLALTAYFGGPQFADTVRKVRLYLNWRAIDDGRPGVLERPAERLYLSLFLLVVGTFLSYRYQNGPSNELTVILQIAIFAFGIPWWWHHRYRTRKPMNKYAMRWRRIAGADTRELKGWVNSKVVAIQGTRAHPVLVVRLTAGRTIKQVGASSGNVASSLGLRPGAVTVMGDPSAEARVRVRIVPRDPWKAKLIHPVPGPGTFSLKSAPRIDMGKFEDATSVMYKVLQHLLVVGRSGSGKSVWLESFAAWLLSYTDARIVAADFASGATFGIWSDAFVVPTATTIEEGKSLVARVFQEILYRERLLATRKAAGHLIDTLQIDEQFPALFFFIDEFPDLIKAAGRDVLLLLERLAAKGRKVNVWLVLGAQNPTAHDVGSTELRGQLTATVGLGLKEHGSKILWGSQHNEGWNSAPLGLGEFLLQDPDNQEPRRAKGLWLPPEKRLQIIRDAAASPRRLDATTLRTLCGAPEPATVGGGGTAVLEDEPLEVESRKTPAEEQDAAVWAALPESGGLGPAAVVTTTGLKLDIVNRTLRRLEKSGRVEKIGHGRWVRHG